MRRRRSEIRGALRSAKGQEAKGLGQASPPVRGSRRRFRPKHRPKGVRPHGIAPQRKGEGKRRYL